MSFPSWVVKCPNFKKHVNVQVFDDKFSMITVNNKHNQCNHPIPLNYTYVQLPTDYITMNN